MPLRNFGLSFSRRGARPHSGVTWLVFLVVAAVVALVLIALARAQPAPTQDQITAQRIIIDDWPALAGACIAPTVQRLPDGKLHAWCRNGERFHIELTSPPNSIWKGGPSVVRCDTVFRGAMQCRW